MAHTVADQPAFIFRGFQSPNYTQVPDELFDELLPLLKEAELKVLLYIVRRTFGFKKERDPISFTQFINGITTKDGRILDRGCGVKSPTHLSNALKSLEEKGIIVSHKSGDLRRGKQATEYSLHFHNGVLPEGEHPTTQTVVPLLPEAYPQETDSQETVKQQTETKDLSRPRQTSIRKKQVYDEARLTLIEYVSDLSSEFIDTASIEASTTRAVNLYRKSELSLEQFIDIMTEARAITKERMASIKKKTREGDKSKMAYFFAVLEDRLSLEQQTSHPS